MATQVTVLAPPAKPCSLILTTNQPAHWLPGSSQTVTAPHRYIEQGPSANSNIDSGATAQPFDISARSVQCVASPGSTVKLQATLPGAIQDAFRSVSCFAGCMVMVADQEARRVTIVTFWKGRDRVRHCAENAERLRMLLFPYVDHWLRSEDFVAHLKLTSEFEQTPESEAFREANSTVNA